MTRDIATYILSQIDSMVWLDKYAGMVRTQVKSDTTKDRGKIIKRFPVSCDVTPEECNNTERLLHLVPDNTKKSVLYFEEINGATLIERKGQRLHWSSTIRLVAWINIPKLGYDQCSLSAILIGDIIKRLPLGVPNDPGGVYHRIHIEVSNQVQKEANIFNRYTYDEEITQYLMFPFDYFALNLAIDFWTHDNCFETFILGAEDPCLTT